MERPACANTMLLRDHLRDAWHFDGYVVSDCAAVADVNTGHHFAPDMAHAAAAAVKAGTDLECGFGQGQAFPALVEAVQQQLITEADLDIALHRLFRARFRLGMFDPPSSYAYGRIPFSEDNSPEHRQLALQASRESMVLLKNQDHTLPLKSSVGRIAVVGPTAELVQSLQGNYNGPPPEPVYPLEGIEKRFTSARINYAQGSSLVEGLAMPIEHTALHPASGSGDGLTGEYFSSKDLSGTPVLTRDDRNINFNWDKVAPVDGLQRNNYSVRWDGSFVPPAPGDYKLGVRVNYCYACENAEGFRLYLDGKVLVESSRRKPANAARSSKPPCISTTTSRIPFVLSISMAAAAPGSTSPGRRLLPSCATRHVHAARHSDVIIALVGLSPSLEGEEMPVKLEGFSGGDRTAIDLPAVQEDLLKALAATGKPLVVVLQNGSALAVNWAQQHANAILEAWYPGEEGGTAIAETLAGDNNPAGRLPLTFYASLGPVAIFRGLLHEGPHLSLFLRRAALSLWLWTELHHLCLQQSQGAAGEREGRRSRDHRGRCEKRGLQFRRRGRRALPHATERFRNSHPRARRVQARAAECRSIYARRPHYRPALARPGRREGRTRDPPWRVHQCHSEVRNRMKLPLFSLTNSL